MELTDNEKIEKLWGSLDKAKQSEASLQVLLEVTEKKNEQLKDVIAAHERTIKALTDEIRRLGQELNQARVAAANSVRDYISSIGD